LEGGELGDPPKRGEGGEGVRRGTDKFIGFEFQHVGLYQEKT